MKTMMNQQQIDEITKQIKKVLDHYRKMEKHFEDIEQALGIKDYWTTSGGGLTYNIMDDYIRLVMEKIGDKNKILYHYVFNAACGKGDNLKIKTISNTNHLINSDESLICAIIFFIDTDEKIQSIGTM